jgi:hypothetical protein
MAARLSALLPRLAVLTVIWLLATSAVTFAAGGRESEEPPAPAGGPAEPSYLVVPDVRGQAYVFAKGILEEAGFAWRVEGPVQGYAANTVAAQDPAPGTKLEDTGSPLITLRLARNSAYPERGLPENRSAVAGTAPVLAGAPARETAPPETTPTETTPTETAPTETTPTETAPTETTPADETSEGDGGDKKQTPAGKDPRAPAFVVPGAPAEPRDEMPLPQRAKLLEKRMAAIRKPTPKIVRYWLYQHSWIVTGAGFGWSGGAEALRTLIRVDERLQARFEFGKRSAAVARAALAEVERRTAG